MPKRRKNEYKERRASEFRDEYTRICETNRVRIIRIFGTGSSPGSRWSRYGQARRARFTTSDLFQSRSKDLERTEPPYLHTPPISMSCSPFPLRRRCSMQITIFPLLLVRRYENICRFSVKITFFSLLARASSSFRPLLDAPVQFAISRCYEKSQQRGSYDFIIAN